MSEWIEWCGSKKEGLPYPFPDGTLVDVRFRDGEELHGLPCGVPTRKERDAVRAFWHHYGLGNEIIAYRLHESNNEKIKASNNRVMAESPIKDQPQPKQSTHPAVWRLVMKDMVDRDQTGRERYGVPLQGHNGRDALVDAYQEALDLAVYLRQAIYERDGK